MDRRSEASACPWTFPQRKRKLFHRMRSGWVQCLYLSLFIRGTDAVCPIDYLWCSTCTNCSTITHVRARRLTPRNRKQSDLGRNQTQGPIIQRLVDRFAILRRCLTKNSFRYRTRFRFASVLICSVCSFFLSRCTSGFG